MPTPITPEEVDPPKLGPPPVYRRQPVEAYCRFLHVFRTRVYSVWPIVSCDSLERRLVEDDTTKDENNYDYEAWTLAAAACAAVIAQLRLPEHLPEHFPNSSSSNSVSSRFAADAEHFRTRTRHHSGYDAREHISVSSLLASFFLHIYYANAGRLRTAGLCLRESLTQAHMLGLHRSDTYTYGAMPDDDRELRLRVYWILFVSERTYCVQHGLPPILRPIRERPARSSAAVASLLDLTRLFTFLDGDLIEPEAMSSSNIVLHKDDGNDRQTRRRVALFQSFLDMDPSTTAAEKQPLLQGNGAEIDVDETQHVDLFVTRNWIRILLWEYSVRNFVMSSSISHTSSLSSSSSPEHNNQAFSMLLPALVAHSMLGFFSTISPESIRAHGYGMELKVFRIADSLLDVLACNSGSTDGGMLFGSRDTLHGLERVLATVGGTDSVFVSRLHSRMAEVQLPVAAAAPMLLWPVATDEPTASVQDVTDDNTDLSTLILSLQETETHTDASVPGIGLVDNFDVNDVLAMDMDLSVLDGDPFIVGFC
ncbi:hypothetical protein Sste5346_007126 [Sporothrix stenoceras]|uniref:Xylanolytic transcriptional activator regulatory domain-containing protein n=1 Tax=Sporothrix stenoceras TaxID=5173 RepID=A0ABR3YVI5_9PEZI